MSPARFLGVTVLTDFIPNDGTESVLENVYGKAGATAVACNPTMTAPTLQGTGSFQPPDDSGSSSRLFDRPLRGKKVALHERRPKLPSHCGPVQARPLLPSQAR